MRNFLGLRGDNRSSPSGRVSGPNRVANAANNRAVNNNTANNIVANNNAAIPRGAGGRRDGANRTSAGDVSATLQRQMVNNSGSNADEGPLFARGRRSGGPGNNSSVNRDTANVANGPEADPGANVTGRGARGGGRGNRVLRLDSNGSASTANDVLNALRGENGRLGARDATTRRGGGPANDANQIAGDQGAGGLRGARGGRGGRGGDGVDALGARRGGRGNRGGRGGPGQIVGDSGNRERNFANRNFGGGRDGDHRNWSGQWRDGDRFAVADRIRDDWRGRRRDHDDVPFRSGWWRDHDRDYYHRHSYWNVFLGFSHYDPYYWWGWSAAPRLSTWFTFGWPTPYYWDYGYGEYIYCYDRVIYVNGRWFAPAPVYYQQTVALAQTAPVLTPQQALEVEWLPLGVFAVARDGVADANLLVQLAVTADGVIGGTALNQSTGASYPIEGTVDKQTQRAVWTYVDATGAVVAMESSIFNLTESEATGLIHYGPDDIQVIELIRLEQPAIDQ